jgi:hypothetical protein
MKHLSELVLPLLLVVEQELPRLAGIRLDEAEYPPFETDSARNAHDPMLLAIPIDRLQPSAHLSPSVLGLLTRARASSSTHVQAADVISATCAAVVEDALASGTLHLANVRAA